MWWGYILFQEAFLILCGSVDQNCTTFTDPQTCKFASCWKEMDINMRERLLRNKNGLIGPSDISDAADWKLELWNDASHLWIFGGSHFADWERQNYKTRWNNCHQLPCIIDMYQMLLNILYVMNDSRYNLSSCVLASGKIVIVRQIIYSIPLTPS